MKYVSWSLGIKRQAEFAAVVRYFHGKTGHPRAPGGQGRLPAGEDVRAKTG